MKTDRIVALAAIYNGASRPPRVHLTTRARDAPTDDPVFANLTSLAGSTPAAVPTQTRRPRMATGARGRWLWLREGESSRLQLNSRPPPNRGGLGFRHKIARRQQRSGEVRRVATPGNVVHPGPRASTPRWRAAVLRSWRAFARVAALPRPPMAKTSQFVWHEVPDIGCPVHHHS